MRIAEVVDSLAIGGAERLVADLARQFKARGHAVEVICIRGEGPLAAPLREAGITVTSLKKAEGFSLRVARELAAVLRESRSDVVHTHNPLVNHYGVIGGRMAGVPVIVNTLHGPGNLDDSRKTRSVYELSSLFSTRVVCVCHALESHLREVTLLARRKSTVVPNGIPLEQFACIRPSEPGGEFIFGAVGRLAAVKDHRTLLRAHALLVQRYPQARLHLLGDGPLRAELEALANQLGVADTVRFEGSTLNVPAFLARLRTLILCSLSEGLPLTLIEGMAAGLPMIVTRVGGMPEIVQGAGCGWLCAPGNHEALASCMEKAIKSPDLATLGMRGRQYALKYHSLDAMTDGYEKLFYGLLNARNTTAPATQLDESGRLC